MILLTPHKLYPSSHPSDSARDQIRDATSHQRCEGHQKQKSATRTRHHGADPPFQTRNALEGGIPSTLLQHHRSTTGFIPYWVRTTPECSKGHWLAHLRPKEPVRHEKAHARSCRTEKGKQSPNHTCTGQTGCHLGTARLHHSSNFLTDAIQSNLSVTTAYSTTNPDPPSVFLQGYTWGDSKKCGNVSKSLGHVSTTINLMWRLYLLQHKYTTETHTFLSLVYEWLVLRVTCLFVTWLSACYGIYINMYVRIWQMLLSKVNNSANKLYVS